MYAIKRKIMTTENSHILIANDFNIADDIIPYSFIQTTKKIPKNIAFQYRTAQNNWKQITWYESMECVVHLACAFAASGVKAGDKAALIADNRYEWILTDLALQLNGAISVPRGSDSTSDELEYIMEHSECSLIIAENKGVLEKIHSYAKKNSISSVIVYDYSDSMEKSVLSFQKMIEKGKKLRSEYEDEILNRLKKIKTDDVFTIIYTSGTTGAPKGVMLTHSNIMHQIAELPKYRGMVFGKDRWLSILPVWHVFERTAEYVGIVTGGRLIYTSLRHVKNDIREQRPTLMASAPRLWETVYLGIQKTIDSGSSIKKTLFKMAYSLAHTKGGMIRFIKGNHLKKNKPCHLIDIPKALFFLVALIPVYPLFLLLDFIVLSKIRAATGGKLKASISGGGALPGHVDEFFNNIGIPVLEGYGMTEAAPVIAARDFKNMVIGSVGIVLEGVDVQIRDFENNLLPRGAKGVIWAKGPNVMKGYYKMPEKTSETIIDGWLNTGDMGFISFNNTLTLTGRAKETIVLLSGENIEPVPIENKILKSPFIDHIMVTGQDKKYLTCILYPNLEEIAKKFQLDLNSITVESIKDNEEIKSFIAKEIKRYSSTEFGFKYFEKVQDFRIAYKPFEQEDELTGLGKMKRHIITERYEKEIESMYEN